MNNYINEEIFGLPKPKKIGKNTSPTSKRKNKEYIHKCKIKNNVYYKVHVKRSGISKIRYFKTLKNANFFVMFMREFKTI